jgi:hypothetical protein
MPGAYAADPFAAPETDSAGRCRLELPATGYWIEFRRWAVGEDFPDKIGMGRAVVVAGHVSEVLLTVEDE